MKEGKEAVVTGLGLPLKTWIRRFSIFSSKEELIKMKRNVQASICIDITLVMRMEYLSLGFSSQVRQDGVIHVGLRNGQAHLSDVNLDYSFRISFYIKRKSFACKGNLSTSKERS